MKSRVPFFKNFELHEFIYTISNLLCVQQIPIAINNTLRIFHDFSKQMQDLYLVYLLCIQQIFISKYNLKYKLNMKNFIDPKLLKEEPI